jgi:hypothetical protein
LGTLKYKLYCPLRYLTDLWVFPPVCSIAFARDLIPDQMLKAMASYPWRKWINHLLLILLYVHKDIEIDFSKVVEMYARQYPRRMLFFNPLSNWLVWNYLETIVYMYYKFSSLLTFIPKDLGNGWVHYSTNSTVR